LPKEAFTSGVLASPGKVFRDGGWHGSHIQSRKTRISFQRKDTYGGMADRDWIYPRDEAEQAFFVLETRVQVGMKEAGYV